MFIKKNAHHAHFFTSIKYYATLFESKMLIFAHSI